MRIVINIALFLLPFVAFFGYAIWANKRRRTQGVDPLNTPWFWLLVAGLVAAIIGFFVLRALIDSNDDESYVPAVVRDGKIVPGHFEKAGQPAPETPPGDP